VSVASTRLAPADLIRTGLVASTAGLATSAAAPNAAVLAVGMVLAGLGGAFIWVPAPGLAGSVVPSHAAASPSGWSGSGIGVSVVLASQLAGLVRRTRRARARGARCGPWRPGWRPWSWSSRWCGCGRPPPTAPPSASASPPCRAVPGWVGLAGGYAAYGFGYAIYVNYLVAALRGGRRLLPRPRLVVFAALGVAMACGGVLVGRLSDRLGRRPALIGGYVRHGACPLLALTGREPWALVSAVVFGLAMSGHPDRDRRPPGRHPPPPVVPLPPSAP
jgi:predicted MFS family arabinose efflux permease